ncbi:Putative defective protein IntQ [Mycobacterium talmoniae]|uniref:Defective protein IntQ n=1 Tax=Mycobacterium talmoniae TaxID=1858794 RepID=A0A2S8BGG6_9MYCO|nr:Putative defective protein IntQ [Mycobacterium talmoniae]
MPEPRRQLPPQIKRVELAKRAGGRPVVRYQLTVDTGLGPDGKRKQFRKRYATEREARDKLDEIRGQVAAGIYVAPDKLTVAQACENWLAGKKAADRAESTVDGYIEKLSVVVAELGDVEVQKLTKRHIDDLVIALRAGGLPSPTGKTRKPWSPRSVNYLLGLLESILDSEVKQGHVIRNVVALVDRIDGDAKPPDPLSEDEVEKVLAHIEGDRYAIAWHLALTGMRLGEICGLRWSDIDLEAKTLAIENTRLQRGKKRIEKTPKSRAGRRELPIPDHLVAVLKVNRKIQAADRLRLGEAYEASGYVVVDEAGAPLTPNAVESRWPRMLKAAGVRHHRLHDARHTCGTLMHLKGVPIAVISAWLGHASKAFTLQTYVNPKPEALAAAAQSFARVVTIRDNSGPSGGR